MIKVINLSKKYRDRVIFEGVNLEIPDKSLVVIIGESGSGKSTFLNILAGLEKPTGGEVLVDTKEIGFILQGSYMDSALTLRENIALPGVFKKMKREDREKRISELALKLGISERLDQLPRESSGGEVERAAVARALLLNPGIILADEPTANLDSRNSYNVLALLKGLCRELNITVVVSSHDKSALEFADQVFLVENKTIRGV